MHKVEQSFLSVIRSDQLHLTGAVLGLSGGVDSVVLLTLLKKFGVHFIAVHVNYGLRGRESMEDENFIRALCQSEGIMLEVFHFNKSEDVTKGESLQMAARRFRYEKFALVREKYALSHIALAHHMDDFLETMLINLTRGTGPAGLAMREKEPFIRPLKNVWKKDILEYAALHQLSWREDSSNQQDKYERNRIRRHVLPSLKTLHPRAEAGLEKSVKNIQLLYTYLKNQAAEYLSRHKQVYRSGFKISLKAFLPWKDEYSPLLFEIFRLEHLTDISMDDFAAGFDSNESKIWKTGGPLVFTKSAELYIFPEEFQKFNKSYYQEWNNLHKPCVVSDWGVVWQEATGDAVWFDASILMKKIVFRTWSPSDRIQLGGFSKRVSNLIKDCKLDFVSRKYVLVMTVDNEVAWVVGIRQSEKFKSNIGSGVPLKAESQWL